MDENLEKLEALQTEILTPAQVSSVLKCTPQYIRIMAKESPESLGFSVIRIGNRTKILKDSFLDFCRNQKSVSNKRSGRDGDSGYRQMKRIQ
ncbi:MAG: hypothetical protein ACOX68_04800 [Candidatus Limivicinus sp.]